MKTGGASFSLMLVLWLLCTPSVAQQDSSKSFTISLEFRPRMEYRDGWKTLPNDTTAAAYFGTHRSRLNFTYQQPGFKFHTSLQDIRVWGQYGQTSTNGSFNVFETYVEPSLSEKWRLRIGRQAVQLDNGRLFSAANWSQASRAHDGLNLIYQQKHLLSEALLFFNQTSERVFGTDFSLNNYKLLGVHHLRARLGDYLTLTTINAVDGYQSATTPRVMYARGTSGGRLAFEKNRWYFTVSGYGQYGQLASGQEVRAYYLQPEIRYSAGKWISRLGMEYLSGDDMMNPDAISNSFETLYGVAFKFMGNLNYFTSFPDNTNGGGLIDPYLFVSYQLSDRVQLRADGHVFLLQNDVPGYNGEVLDAYLGWENDLSMKYVINDYTRLKWGVSYMVAEQSMEVLKGGDSNLIPVWSYVMVTFKPDLFSFKGSSRSVPQRKHDGSGNGQGRNASTPR